MASITTEQRKASEAYESAGPVQFGNLHERMKFLLLLLTKAVDERESQEAHALCTAVYDLETELRGHTPIEPPVARRVHPRGSAGG